MRIFIVIMPFHFEDDFQFDWRTEWQAGFAEDQPYKRA